MNDMVRTYVTALGYTYASAPAAVALLSGKSLLTVGADLSIVALWHAARLLRRS